MEVLTVDQIDSLYNQVHNDEDGTANSISNADLDETQKSAAAVMMKVAKESSLEEFRLFVQSEEMPPVSLTEAELAALMGGGEKFQRACMVAMVMLEAASQCMSGGGGTNNGKKKSNASGAN